ncbi:MAG: four helix bundle protein [Bacteroidota bacterium]
MNEKIKTYRDLIVWQKSVAFVTSVYTTTKLFPQEEKFGIVSQLNRASVSIPSNIAEGYGRESSKNYLQFLKIARGSLMETETLIEISKNLNFINELTYNSMTNDLNEISKILQGLIKSVQQKINVN